MVNNIPEIDDLTKGINDPDMTLTGTQKEEEPQSQTEAVIQTFSQHDSCWEDFLKRLKAADRKSDKSDRMVCKLDRDLADSLDDCDINNHCRSDLVNAIVRAFFETYLPQLVQYKRENKSLFMNLKET